MFVLQVIPITKSIRTSSLSYFSAKDVDLGTLVTVPLRKQEVSAVVVAKESVSDLKTILKSADYRIRNVLQIHDKHLFSPAFLRMAHYSAQYNAQPTGVILDTLLPKSVTRDISFFARTFSGLTKKVDQRNSLLQRSTEERYSYYKTRTRELFAQNQSLVIVCPTVEECNTLYSSVSKAISQQSYIFHGSLTAKKIKDTYTLLQKNTGPVLIVTTAGCISFAPENTAEYIIESCSSSAYRNVSNPRIDKRLCVELTAQFSGACCVYADSVIGADIWHRSIDKQVDIIEPYRKKIFDSQRVKILSYQPKQEKQSEAERIKELTHSKSGFHPLHYQSIEAITAALASKKKVVVFVPKKGKSPNMVCNDCGKLAVSESGHPLSLYTHINPQTKNKEHIYVCNATGQKMPAFDECQFCKGVSLKKMGLATSGVAELLRTQLGERAPVSIVDGQFCKTKKAIKEAQEYARGDKGHVFVATSKVLTVLPCWDETIITTVAPLLSRMSYRNEEEIVLLLAAFHERTQGTMYIQDRKDICDSFPILHNGLYQPFIEEQLSQRKQYQYPPYNRLIQLKAEIKKSDMKAMYHYLLKKYESYDPSILLAPSSKTHGVLNMMITKNISDWSLMNQEQKLLSLLRDHERNVQVVIDPQSIA